MEVEKRGDIIPSFNGIGTASSVILNSARSFIAMLEEPDVDIKVYALTKLNQFVDQLWPNIVGSLDKIEILYEDETFPQQNLAALVASKVYFQLNELDESLKYALGAGESFTLTLTSEFTKTILVKCIDSYIDLRTKKNSVIDPRLEYIVNSMFERYLKEGEYYQVLGIALECRRLDTIRKCIELCGDIKLLQHCFSLAVTVIEPREYRVQLLGLLLELFVEAKTVDYVSISQLLLLLGDHIRIAQVLDSLIRESNDSALMAYQVAFYLTETEHQIFLLNTVSVLDPSGNIALTTAPKDDSDTRSVVPFNDEDISYNARKSRLLAILKGEITSLLYLQFLFTQNHTDLLYFNNIRDKIGVRRSALHNALICAHAFAQCGSTNDQWIRDNLDYFGNAKNWAKFTAAASIGLIHKGHRSASLKVLADYLPQQGQPSSFYQEGGALFALGLIHHNHGGEMSDYLINALKNAANNEITQHGVCLGLGLVSLGTGNKEIYQLIKNVLFSDSAVAGEAAGIAIGLVMLGSCDSEVLQELITYAHDTSHEKIIRGISMGCALIGYGREEGADGLIEQLLHDKDPILRYGGVYTIGLAYVCTSSNKSVRQLLHLAVSDVSDDVRRAAVTCLGFVMASEPQKVPGMVSLLAESYNAHVRYGAAMALGLCCSGTGMKEALDLLFPLSKDKVDFVRHAAIVALSMVLIQMNDVEEPKVAKFNNQLVEIIEDKTRDEVTKMGAILASGILNAGGRNVTISLRTPTLYPRMATIVGMALFLQYWYWFPLSHFLSLSFSPTALLAVNSVLRMPSDIKFVSNAKSSLFAYPKPTQVKTEAKATRLPTATLSVTAKAKSKAKKKSERMDLESSQILEKKPSEVKKDLERMDVETTPTQNVTQTEKSVEEIKREEKKVTMDIETPSSSIENLPSTTKSEPEFSILPNPTRVTPSQEKLLDLAHEQRYQPVFSRIHGIIVVRDLRPADPETFIKPMSLKSLGVKEIEEAPSPLPFTYYPPK